MAPRGVPNSGRSTLLGALLLVALCLAPALRPGDELAPSWRAIAAERGARGRDLWSKSSGGQQQKRERRPPPVYTLDNSTRVILVDKSNEFGFLEAKIGQQQQQQQQHGDHLPEGVHRFERLASEEAPGEAAAGTNFSVFLVSREPSHLAVLVEFERIDFEPRSNCDDQELRFSIASEIKERQGEGAADDAKEQEEQDGEEAEEEEEEEEESDESNSDAMSASEMVMALLNNPLNRTFLREPAQQNPLKSVDSSIDLLQEIACKEWLLNHESQRNKPAPSPQALELSGAWRASLAERPEARAPNKGRKRQRRQAEHCSMADANYRDLLGGVLERFIEWDEFKVVCGDTRRLLVPMRSFKLSVFSDEFAPASSFRLKYRFVRDANELPAADNGQFYCRNRRVIKLALRCDGFDDCGDASDESGRLCGFPGGRPASRAAAAASAREHSQRRLAYYATERAHCCQPGEWQREAAAGAGAGQALHALLGDTMQLFSGPLLAPTGASARPPRVKRIVGGARAPPGSWHAQVSLQSELVEPLFHFCGATLVHPQYLLTAGHCVTRAAFGQGIRAVFGAHDLRRANHELSGRVQVRYADDALVYPGVDVKRLPFEWDNDMSNDLALVRLNAPVHVTQHVAPACLPPFNTPLALNTSCQSLGWGETHGSGSSNVLKQLELQVAPGANCSRELFERDTIYQRRRPGALAAAKVEANSVDSYSNQTMICVSNPNGHGVCQGDSGGPLYCERKLDTGKTCLEIYGLASFVIKYATVGPLCAVENLPEVFAEVSSKTEWISSTIRMFEQKYRLQYP